MLGMNIVTEKLSTTSNKTHMHESLRNSLALDSRCKTKYPAANVRGNCLSNPCLFPKIVY